MEQKRILLYDIIMNEPKQNTFLKILSVTNIVRLVIVNIVFLFILFIIIVIAILVGKPENAVAVSDSSVLIINPSGRIVEEYTTTDFQRSFSEYMNEAPGETLLQDITSSIRNGAEDSRIQGILLDFSGLESVSLSAVQEIRGDLETFQNSGKKVYAYSYYYNQIMYYLASRCDEIIIDPMGIVMLKGLGIYRSYYKEGLDRFGIEIHVFRAGEYKSFVEPFMRASMSETEKEQNLLWLSSLWSSILNETAEGRNVTAADLQSFSDNYSQILTENGNSPVTAALSYNLIDSVKTGREMDDYLAGIYGYDRKTDSFPSVMFTDYNDSMKKKSDTSAFNGNKIGLIIAEGDIISGEGYYGLIGSKTYSDLIASAVKDRSIKALVIRLNTGGGSSFAAEEIRRSVDEFRKTGRPVVVSMGDTAASGGYWIAMESDFIYAYRTTLTGSIGVFSVAPTFQKPLKQYLGINADGIGTTEMSSLNRLDMEMSPDAEAVYQSQVDWIYDNFISLLTEKRRMEKAAALEIAGGKVWSGEQALNIGLIDDIGNIDDAVGTAAELSGLGEDFSLVTLKPDMNIETSLRRMPFAAVYEKKGKVTGMDPDVIARLIKNTVPEMDFNDPAGINAFIDIRFIP